MRRLHLRALSLAAAGCACGSAFTPLPLGQRATAAWRGARTPQEVSAVLRGEAAAVAAAGMSVRCSELWTAAKAVDVAPPFCTQVEFEVATAAAAKLLEEIEARDVERGGAGYQLLKRGAGRVLINGWQLFITASLSYRVYQALGGRALLDFPIDVMHMTR